MSAPPKRRVLFLMNRWLSAAGGIQTVNRQLACALAKLDTTFDVVGIVPAASDSEVHHADQNGVTLIRGRSQDDWLSVLLRRDVRSLGPSVTAVVGHSHFSGPQALLLRDEVFPAATAVQFVHMSPMHTEHLKEYRKDHYIAERESRLGIELDLAKRADIVACIGPRLHRYMNQKLVAARAKPLVIRVDCGLERMEGDRVPVEQPTVLCMGRADSIFVKGIDLFAKAAGLLTDRWHNHPATRKRPAVEFVVRGAKEMPEALQEKLTQLSKTDGRPAHIQVRPYTTDGDVLREDLRAASVFVMPSREEGFGLVACEALSLGVPVVISSESGLAEVIDEMARRTGLDVSDTIVPHGGGNDDVIVARYADRILTALVDDHAAAQRAHRMFEHLLSTTSWTEAAKALRDALNHLPAASAVAAPSARSDYPADDGSNLSDAMVPGESAPAVRASGDARRSELSETLQRHAALLRSPGIIGHLVRHTIVVVVEEGADVKLPERLDDTDVVIRRFNVRLSSGVTLRSGDWLRVSGGTRVARVGMWVTDSTDSLFLTTVAHAVGSSPTPPQVTVRSAVSDEDVPALVVRSDTKADIALIAVPSASVMRSPVTLGDPSLELAVRFVLPDHVVTGIVSGISATLVGEFAGEEPMTDLFEVRVAEGTLQPGDSGCVLVDNVGRPIGFLAAVAREQGSEGAQLAFAKSISAAFAVAGVRPVAFETPPLATIPRRATPVAPEATPMPARARVGIIADSHSTLNLILESLKDTTREQRATISSFRADLDSGGPSLIIHGLESMGNLSAAVATTNLLRENKIDGVILVGLAGGVPSSDVAVGDIVVSSEIIHYEPARITDEGIDPRFRVVGLTPGWLTSLAKDLGRDPAIASILGRPAGNLKVHVGAVASGEKVLFSAKQLRELLGNWGRVLAVEMEGAGVATAVSMSGMDVPLVIVRGVADLMDGAKRDRDERDAAARHAVRFALALSRKFRRTRQHE